ncbi:MAG: phosphate/phosphite/phosphonate ABC transporter substrate-binding protein, partial [Polyangiaceae bacterium]
LIPGGGEGDADGREGELLAAFAEALGQDVDVHRAPDYGVVLAGLRQGLVDLAWLPPLTAARAVKGGVADPVALSVRHGSSSYTTVLVTSPASPLRSVGELRGALVAWVDRESASGYVVLRAAMARSGVRLTEAFAEETFVRSHGAVARAVLEGRVDVGATCAHEEGGTVRFARSAFAGDSGLAHDDLRVLFEAGPIPADLFAVRAGLAPRVRAALESGLLRGRPERLRAAACAFLHADSFASPTPEHRRMLASLLDD